MKTTNKVTEKHILLQLEDIEKQLPALSTGTQNWLFNRISQIRLRMKRGNPVADPAAPAYYEPTYEQISDRESGHKALFEAMKYGKYTCEDGRRFRLNQMNTAFVKIRQRIQKKHLPWIMKSEPWTTRTGKPCKRYWLEPAEEDNIN